jgi:hypothetical protein
MNDDSRQQAFMSALVTEHFVLQSARGVATSEANGRAALYLTSLTGALVALGFVAQVGEQFDAFAAAVLPALFLLGEFTYVRLLENSIEDWLLQRSIQRIRRYYLALVPEAAAFFGDADVDRKPSSTMYRSSAQLLFTAASMIAAINAILSGAGVTCWSGRWTWPGSAPRPWPGLRRRCWCSACTSGTSGAASARPSRAWPGRTPAAPPPASRAAEASGRPYHPTPAGPARARRNPAGEGRYP